MGDISFVNVYVLQIAIIPLLGVEYVKVPGIILAFLYFEFHLFPFVISYYYSVLSLTVDGSLKYQ